MQAHVAREAARTGARIPLDVASLVLLIVLVGVYGAHRLLTASDDDEFGEKARRAFGGLRGGAEAAAPRPAAARPTAVPPRSAPPPSIQALPQVSDFAPTVRSLPPTPTPATAPTPAPAPTPNDEREQMRAAGLRRYKDDLDGLLDSARRLAEHVRVYKSDCASNQKVGSRVSNCAEIETAIRSRVGEIQQALESAEDQARRAWLEPGTVRDARAQGYFGSRQWDELQRSAADLKKP